MITNNKELWDFTHGTATTITVRVPFSNYVHFDEMHSWLGSHLKDDCFYSMNYSLIDANKKALVIKFIEPEDALQFKLVWA